jgi:twitching motility two-component system response regulator PilG
VKKFLFIDSSEAVIKVVKNLLEATACQFYSALNGIDGLCEMVAQEPDVIFIEANAAQLDGYHFCALVKGKPEYSHIPIILVLDQNDYLERAKAEALGAETVLCKPFGKSELLNVIAEQQDEAA